MEEPPVEAARLELAHRPVVAVRQDRLRAVGRAARSRANRSAIVAERLVPGDPLEPPLPLRPDPPQRVHEPVGAVDAVEVAGHLLAEEPPRERVLRVAAQVDRAPSSTVTTMPQVSGQSCGQTPLTTVRSPVAISRSSHVRGRSPARILPSPSGSEEATRCRGSHPGLNPDLGMVLNSKRLHG